MEVDGKDKAFSEQLRQAMDEKDFDPRSALGQRFNKAHKMASKAWDNYKEMASHKDKAAFRVQWAAAELQKLKQTKSYLMRFQEVDEQKGQHLPFARIEKEEGGDPSATRAAYLYCSKAAAMQGKWVSMNPVTERWEY